MLHKSAKMLYRTGLIAAGILISAVGCGNKLQDNGKESMQNISQNDEMILEVFLNIYEEANKEESFYNLETIRSIINQLGENGYATVDSQNQIDMTCSEQIEEFCQRVEKKEEAETEIIIVSYDGGFTKYDLSTKSGSVNVIKRDYIYEDGIIENINSAEYMAETWNYTEEGYLFFGGSSNSEIYQVMLLSEMPERAAVRVLPLDEKCRELNRKYILPIGYCHNNMFISDWSENDFGELDFYDMFDVLYPLVYNRPIPYVLDLNLDEGAIYHITTEEFEGVIMEYFNIDRNELRERTNYFRENNTYEYKPRGFYETEFQDVPYPEVIRYKENTDGTLSLTVNAVYHKLCTSKAYVHEVVVCPLADGGVKYISNKIIPSDDNFEEDWHKPRLTEESWEEVYGH
ncbi:hypothetical protein IMSAG049_01536 [Clostridiales bacterium]|nr:hypothetical protein IMSAG049_01536 [Clostridiales bacterium]